MCGEHGGDPESIALFYDAGLDYVSCSPFRVPIARLAAAQAIVGAATLDQVSDNRHPMTPLLAAESSGNFVELDVHAWQWLALLGLIVALLLVDLLVVHREAHEVSTKEAAIESAVWISIGVGFSLVVLWWFGGAATGEYISGYLIEKSLSIDNVFVWALILSYFAVPPKYQHRVLFWGIFGALVMRAIFIFAGVALIERFDWILYVFGAFLLFTAVRMLIVRRRGVDPANSRFLRFVNRVVPSTDKLDGPHLFTKINGKRLATPLFAVLVLVEVTDVIFAVDSVPAVLAVSHEQFIVFSSNAFAILGLRALYFLLADLHARFRYLQQGLAVILAFVGVKMIICRCGIPHPDLDLAADHRTHARRIDRGLVDARARGARRTRERRGDVRGGARRLRPRPDHRPSRHRRPRDARQGLSPERAAGMAIADDDIERLRPTVSIVDVVGEFVSLRKVGRNCVGLCPFHAEKTPSFNVREETGRYHCFGCDQSGDVFTFVHGPATSTSSAPSSTSPPRPGCS